MLIYIESLDETFETVLFDGPDPLNKAPKEGETHELRGYLLTFTHVDLSENVAIATHAPITVHTPDGRTHNQDQIPTHKDWTQIHRYQPTIFYCR